MKLKTFYLALSPDEREQFVKAAGTTVGYMNLLICGARRPSPRLTKKLVVASRGSLGLADLRPDVYGPIIVSAEQPATDSLASA